MLKECNIQYFSIHPKEIEGRLYLFSPEYTGDDWEADIKNTAADPETQKWWNESDTTRLLAVGEIQCSPVYQR